MDYEQIPYIAVMNGNPNLIKKDKLTNFYIEIGKI